LSLLDHFFTPDTDLDKFSRAAYGEAGNFTIEPYSFLPRRSAGEVGLKLERIGQVEGLPVKVTKGISLIAKQALIAIEYEITNLSEQEDEFWFGVEFNFSLLAAKAADRYYKINREKISDGLMGSRGETSGVKSLEMVDNWNKFGVLLELEHSALFWRFPVETVSQSESGFEKTYQGSVLLPSWRITLAPGATWRNRILVRIT
jgi:alpha-amylase